MSATKRSRQVQRQPQAGHVPTIPSPTVDSQAALDDPNLPASKRLKSSHVPNGKSSGLGFLLDEDARDGKKLDARLTNGIPNQKANRVDESNAVVVENMNGDDEVEGDDSDGPSDSGDESEAEEDVDEADDQIKSTPHLNGSARQNRDHDVQLDPLIETEDVDMVDGSEHNGDDSEAEAEPSFGDMLKARHPDPVDVRSELPDPHAEPPHLLPASGKDALIRPVTGHSLTTVLQQALKTNDKDMLESCFHLKDLQAVRNTIQRLQSPLIGDLLTRVAERMYRRPGRTGSLMIWIQWSLVAHGGYLATQPEILRKLKALNQVIKQRAQGLQPLLQLKGKLDMLSAQLDLRRGGLTRRLNSHTDAEDEGIVYVEGQDEADWDEEDEDEEVQPTRLDAPQPSKRNGILSTLDAEDDDDDLVDGDAQEEDDDESIEEEEEDEEDGGMIDIEAEETDDDGSEEDSVQDESESLSGSVEDEEDEGEDEDESDQEIKQLRPQTLNRKR